MAEHEAVHRIPASNQNVRQRRAVERPRMTWPASHERHRDRPDDEVTTATRTLPRQSSTCRAISGHDGPRVDPPLANQATRSAGGLAASISASISADNAAPVQAGIAASGRRTPATHPAEQANRSGDDAMTSGAGTLWTVVA
jgi:hypothetical protein